MKSISAWWVSRDAVQGTLLRDRVRNTLMNRAVRRANLPRIVAVSAVGLAIGILVAPVGGHLGPTVPGAIPVACVLSVAFVSMVQRQRRRSTDDAGPFDADLEIAERNEFERLMDANGTITSSDIASSFRGRSRLRRRRSRQRLVIVPAICILGALAGGAVASWTSFSYRVGVQHDSDSGKQHVPQVTGNGGKVVPNTTSTTISP